MMENKQDSFYLNKEADAFFDRWKKGNDFQTGQIRSNKLEIYNNLKKTLTLITFLSWKLDVLLVT